MSAEGVLWLVAGAMVIAGLFEAIERAAPPPGVKPLPAGCTATGLGIIAGLLGFLVWALSHVRVI